MAAFEAMHGVLDEAWAECERVLAPGGIACVNVGDATRKLDDTFRVYPNHARVTEAFEGLGFDPLPDVLWRKPANSAAEFMDSGTLPLNAYVTLEHEYVLVFRKGSPRSFELRLPRRHETGTGHPAVRRRRRLRDCGGLPAGARPGRGLKRASAFASRRHVTRG